MSVLAGALSPADVTEVPDDAVALRSAAQKFANAVDGVLSAAAAGSRAWAGLPSVFSADALSPALAPLMDPAVQKAREMQSAADEFLRVAARAANDIQDLKRNHDSLVQQIAQFHASAPGEVAAHVAKEAASGNVIGAMAAVAINWQQVPRLVAEEAGLRWRVQAHNESVSSMLNRIASQLDGVNPSAVDAHPVHAAATVSATTGSGGGNWLTDAWHTIEGTAQAGWEGLEAGTEAALPYLQDAAGAAGNVFASLGNAMVNHPDEVLELIGGLAMMVGGTVMEGGGVLLDISVVGAPAGLALNVSGAGVIAGGAALAGTGALGIGVHAMSDDRLAPNRTDHVQTSRNESNPEHPGRNRAGEYQSKDNSEARVDSARKQQEGLDKYERRTGTKPNSDEVVARIDGNAKVRKFDGLAEKPDGTYEGVEVKSGSARRTPQQDAFDKSVSYDNPATATLNGKKILITSTKLINVP